MDQIQKDPAYKYYTRPSIENQMDAIKVIGIIAQIQVPCTVEQFENKCRDYPNYQLDQGGSDHSTALHEASFFGNVELIKHIVKNGGVSLLDQGVYNSPLEVAVSMHVIHNTINTMVVIKELLNLGADVNLVNNYNRNVFDNSLRSILKDDIVYSESIGFNYNSNIVKLAALFLRQGAKPNPESQANPVFNTVKEKSWQWEKLLKLAVIDENSEIGKLEVPLDVINYICKFSLGLDLA